MLPHPALQKYIAHYTFIVANKRKEHQPESLSLVPDASGCIVFTLHENSFDGVVWGATTQIVNVSNNSEHIPLRVFVEFLPAGGYTLLRENQAQFLNKIVKTKDMLPQLHKELECVVTQKGSVDTIVDTLDKFFLKQLEKNKLENHFGIQVTQKINSHRGLLNTKGLEAITNYSARHINRVLNRELGMSVKKFNRLLRINLVLKKMEQTQMTFSELATYAGYYDQSHFIKDFTQVCSVTPGEYMKQIGGFYNENFKF